MINPAKARMLGVNFAGTAVLESEGRRLQVNSASETDIANGILRVSQAATQRVCFLDGHGEPDPFSLESHDHQEGAPGHSHGLGAKYVLHERHGMAKARHALETLNYQVEKVWLLQRGPGLAECGVLVVAGPKVALLPVEVDGDPRVPGRRWQRALHARPVRAHGSRARRCRVRRGRRRRHRDRRGEPLLGGPSAPAVSDYNRHQITRDLPLTFFPGVRSLSPTPQSVRRHFGRAARQLVAAELGPEQSGARRAPPRAATSRARSR